MKIQVRIKNGYQTESFPANAEYTEPRLAAFEGESKPLDPLHECRLCLSLEQAKLLKHWLKQLLKDQR